MLLINKITIPVNNPTKTLPKIEATNSLLIEWLYIEINKQIILRHNNKKIIQTYESVRKFLIILQVSLNFLFNIYFFINQNLTSIQWNSAKNLTVSLIANLFTTPITFFC